MASGSVHLICPPTVYLDSRVASSQINVSLVFPGTPASASLLKWRPSITLRPTWASWLLAWTGPGVTTSTRRALSPAFKFCKWWRKSEYDRSTAMEMDDVRSATCSPQVLRISGTAGYLLRIDRLTLWFAKIFTVWQAVSVKITVPNMAACGKVLKGGWTMNLCLCSLEHSLWCKSVLSLFIHFYEHVKCVLTHQRVEFGHHFLKLIYFICLRTSKIQSFCIRCHKILIKDVYVTIHYVT